MKYNFETSPYRANGGSEKWRDLEKDCKKNSIKIPEGIIPFSVADMEFETAPEITKGLKDYLGCSILGYTCSTDVYKKTVCSYIERKHGYAIGEDELVETRGVVEGVFSAVRAFSNEGDGVIMLTPIYYPLYKAIELNNRKLIRCPLIYTENGYRIDFDLFGELAKEAKLFILCSPHNPTGRVWTTEELTMLGEICLKNNIFVISDEIHMDITMPGHTHIMFPSIANEFAQNSIAFTSPSKSFNLAGLQTSNAIVKNPERRKAFLDSLAASFAFNECGVLGYKACELAYKRCDKWFAQMMKVIVTNKGIIENYIKERLPQVKVLPLEGTYLMWLDMRDTGYSAEELETRMKKNFLYFDEGYIFGEEGIGFERWNIACPTSYIVEALPRLEQALR
jgi:putative C-S lyase